MNSQVKRQLTTVPIEQVPDWDSFVTAHAHGSVFHTKAMIKAIGNTPNYEPLAIAVVEDGGRIAGLLVAVKVSLAGSWPDNLSARSVMLAEPIVVAGPTGAEALTVLLDHHDVMMSDRVVFSEIRPMMETVQHQPTYQASGYQHLDYSNFTLDLKRGADQIFAQMGHKRRNNIRSNQRRGLIVREADAEREVCVLYHHLSTSFKRSRVPLVDSKHFIEVFRHLPSSQYRLTIAELGGKPIASACHFIFNGRVYWWQAGTQRIPGITAQASLVWETIQWAVDHGGSVYDFAGAGWGDKEYGPGIFKARFGGTHVNVGRYRKVYSKLRMKVAEAGYQIARPLLPGPSPSEGHGTSPD